MLGSEHLLFHMHIISGFHSNHDTAVMDDILMGRHEVARAMFYTHVHVRTVLVSVNLLALVCAVPCCSHVPDVARDVWAALSLSRITAIPMSRRILLTLSEGSVPSA